MLFQSLSIYKMPATEMAITTVMTHRYDAHCGSTNLEVSPPCLSTPHWTLPLQLSPIKCGAAWSNAPFLPPGQPHPLIAPSQSQ